MIMRAHHILWQTRYCANKLHVLGVQQSWKEAHTGARHLRVFKAVAVSIAEIEVVKRKGAHVWVRRSGHEVNL